MGVVIVDLTLINASAPERRRTVRAVADTGAMLSSIPASLAQELGLEPARYAQARLADGSRHRIGVVEALRFEIDGRLVSDEALVMGDQVLIGQTVLEKMHLMVDCAGRRLVPDPDQPEYPVYRA
jgi:clan AA aspartic protease